MKKSIVLFGNEISLSITPYRAYRVDVSDRKWPNERYQSWFFRYRFWALRFAREALMREVLTTDDDCVASVHYVQPDGDSKRIWTRIAFIERKVVIQSVK